MKALGIIAEYNPFHNGHRYHIAKAKGLSGADCVIAVVSGNFTQRGEIAIVDKWIKASEAMLGGADLVLEMPLLFACNNAGYFAYGGVGILENLGVSHIAFGSETGNADKLKLIADCYRFEGEKIEKGIRELVKTGMSYPKARSEILGIEGYDGPNDLLAIEYLKFIKKAIPLAIKREAVGHDDEVPSGFFASASLIRKMLLRGEDISKYVPKSTAQILNSCEGRFADENLLFKLVVQKVMSTRAEELNGIFGAEEGLGDKLKNGVRYWKSYGDIVNDLKSKRYTRTRVNRVILNSLLGITRDDVRAAKNYMRLLAFNERGASYLKHVKKNGNCRLPIISNMNKDIVDYPELKQTLAKDILATDIYNLATERDLYENSEYVKKPLKY